MIPKVVKMDVYPVAGHDSMELNLSGAHAPYFTRNVVVLEDSTGNLGVGEVPGGKKITKALENVKELVLDTSIADYKAVPATIMTARKNGNAFLISFMEFSSLFLLESDLLREEFPLSRSQALRLGTSITWLRCTAPDWQEYPPLLRRNRQSWSQNRE